MIADGKFTDRRCHQEIMIVTKVARKNILKQDSDMTKRFAALKTDITQVDAVNSEQRKWRGKLI